MSQNTVWDTNLEAACKQISAHMISLRPCEDEQDGLREMYRYVISLFENQCFEVDLIENPKADYRPVIVAKSGSDKATTVGFFGHYDVEPVDENKWSTDPWILTDVDGRWQGRGVADNIVPLVQKILISPELKKVANIVFVLQGEEEIGSPFAMNEYPNLRLPEIDIWFEETGYFYKNGDHRIMAMNVDDNLERVFSAIEELNSASGRKTKLRVRPMNKAFGNQGCPCLVHLLGDKPYIALGPNDDYSTIHGVDESINPELLGISAMQIFRAIEVFAK